MRGCTRWNYTPYRPLIDRRGEIYITRIVPSKNSVYFEFLRAQNEEYEVFYKEKNEKEWLFFGKIEDDFCQINGLCEGKDYCFYLSCKGTKSSVRLARTGECVGTVVNYLHPDDDYYSFSGKFLCSPSFVRTKEGDLLSSMDLYAHAYPQNLTLVFRSKDNGKTWKYETELMPCFWGKLFSHNGEVYMLACSTEYGDLIIGKFDGKNFGSPVTLLRGANGKNGSEGLHKNPQPPVVFGGRLYFSLEWGSWSNRDFGHSAMVCSVAVEDDLLKPDNWSFTPPIEFEPFSKEIAHLPNATMTIEGTLVVTKDDELYDVMRFGGDHQALCYKVNASNPEEKLSFAKVIDFPANMSKFTIKYDGKSNAYYSVATINYDEENQMARNYLALIKSENLDDWKIIYDIYDYRKEDARKIGFQYCDFDFHGDDIIFVCRTAMNGADSFHNSNYQTFDVIKDFRNK